MLLQQAQRAGIIILDEAPKGWRRLEGALTQPCGYDWYCNGKSRWSGEYEHALVAQERRGDHRDGNFDLQHKKEKKKSKEARK